LRKQGCAGTGIQANAVVLGGRQFCGDARHAVRGQDQVAGVPDVIEHDAEAIVRQRQQPVLLAQEVAQGHGESTVQGLSRPITGRGVDPMQVGEMNDDEATASARAPPGRQKLIETAQEGNVAGCPCRDSFFGRRVHPKKYSAGSMPNEPGSNPLSM
jgi:hypothetical protein